MAEGFAPWCCPLCGAPLAGDNALKCPSGHSFDRAKEGYWHLLPVQNTRTKAPGDSREMVAARRAFLSAGYYGIFGQALGELCLAYGQPKAGKPLPVFSGQNKGFQKKKCRPILTGHKNDVSGNDERQISTSRANTTEISLFFTNRR